MKLQMSFGENLINLRKQKGWSQDDLADNLNLSRQAISKWENDTSKPDIDNIEKISKIFSVTIDDLLNNDVVKDKAVTLNVKKQEKKEKTITIVKCMIVAVIILYIINVIFKFASLLIIVNGIQKYANISNYHYVITTYDENGLVEKEECWFKDGVLKIVNETYSNSYTKSRMTYIDYNKNNGYIQNGETNEKSEIDSNYLSLHSQYKNGGRLFSILPVEIRKNNLVFLLFEVIDIGKFDISIFENNILISSGKKYIQLNKMSMLPTHIYDCQNNNNLIFEIKINDINT